MGMFSIDENCYKYFKTKEDYDSFVNNVREDVIDECIKTIIDYCCGLPNVMYVNALKQLKGE